jgi:hypothetical protein
MADKLKKFQREKRAQRVKELRAAADAWEGACNDKKDPYTGQKDDLGDDRAVRLRAEAATLEADPDFADMPKQAERHAAIASQITAEAEKAGAEALLLARATQQTGREGGLMGGRPARTDWNDPSLELANALVNGKDAYRYRFHGAINKSALAADVLNGWKEKKISPPGYRALCDFLSGCEKDGKLKPQT